MTHGEWNATTWAMKHVIDSEGVGVTGDADEAGAMVLVWDLSGETPDVIGTRYSADARDLRDMVRGVIAQHGTADDLHAFDWAGAI